jgi:hypothetical protein
MINASARLAVRVIFIALMAALTLATALLMVDSYRGTDAPLASSRHEHIHPLAHIWGDSVLAVVKPPTSGGMGEGWGD